MKTPRETIEKIRATLADAAGPIASFVVKKQIKDMGYTEDDFPSEKLPELINRVVENAIYNPEMKEDVRRKLRKVIGG
jgi:hypothetical protein